MPKRAQSVWLATWLAGALALSAVPLSAQQTPPPSREAGLLGTAFSAGASGNWDEARSIASRIGPDARTLVDWQALRAGEGDLPDFARFLDDHAHWPLARSLQRNAEDKLAGADAATVRAFFANRQPITDDGKLALTFALADTDRAAAEALARDLWLTAPLSETAEARLLASFGPSLQDLHAARVDALLWEGERSAAERNLTRLDASQAALARARIALQARQSGVDALVAAVPDALQRDPGLARDRFDFRYRFVSRESAAELMLSQSRAPEGLGRAEAWAQRRIVLVRGAMADGDYERAYALATPHGLDDGIAFVDLAFLAGFIALEYLNKPAEALEHFRALRVRVSSPISLGRAGFWEGRAHERLGDAISAQAAYEFAAEHQTAYYGQLAADRLGLTLDPMLIDGPSYPDWRDTALAQSELLRAAQLLYDSGDWYEARRFLMHLAEQLSTEPELGALSDLALAWGEPNFALKIAKIAVQEGIVLPRAYFPVPQDERRGLTAPDDLVLAVTRRESEFDPRARSRADARGLMQLLPGTGEMMARKLNVAFSPSDLTQDPVLNMRLGAAYLSQLRDEFGPSLGLVAAGYNAGPGRPRSWVGEIGDPRNPQVDFVTWVERVPFAETRNYIMRVAESQVVYRSRLAGSPQPIELESLIRGR
ncbi:lytic transglycosylase domain-containing protein [Roseibaca sp. Y0-43]|uniref:lytic transglycosylase domain-containing protein n=1 Tax=Roseibaca sp. Y0-43 TaxID=2816854 RepID=UPI001D0C0CDF|nr:lytic transglycosylase domain-containing protein [Roseibaca sp. Y0-43]MCC1482433.1 lytic transglycosylase domain-containing protein [Roseibaca sp. Y0-43]